MVTTPANVNDATSSAQHKSCHECLLSQPGSASTSTTASCLAQDQDYVRDNTSNFLSLTTVYGERLRLQLVVCTGIKNIDALVRIVFRCDADVRVNTYGLMLAGHSAARLSFIQDPHLHMHLAHRHRLVFINICSQRPWVDNTFDLSAQITRALPTPLVAALLTVC